VPALWPRSDDPTQAASRDLLLECLWCLTAHAAGAVADRGTMQRAYEALLPAASELAGAGSGLLTVGPVAEHLATLAAARRATDAFST
jgi:hypothetical protein